MFCGGLLLSNAWESFYHESRLSSRNCCEISLFVGRRIVNYLTA